MVRYRSFLPGKVPNAGGRRDAPVRESIDPHVWWIGGVVMLGSIMSILDTTIVNVAVATLGRDLHVSISEVQWVVTGYMLALAAVIPISGWAAQRFGTKRVYLVSLVLFTVGSVLCGLSTSLNELIAFRVLQGVGGGMILPLGQMMVAAAAGPRRMGRVMSIIVVPVMLAPILGPTLGGLIIEDVSWRWIFFVNIPVGAAALIAGIRILPRAEASASRALDVRGLLLMVTGLPLLTYGLAKIGTTGSFTSTEVVVPCVVGLALIAGFVVHATRASAPLLNLRLLRRATFSSASAAMFLLSASMLGSMILLPLYWQEVRRESVILTGLLLAPQGLGAAIVMPFAGKIADRHGGGLLALIGVVVTTVATVPFGLIGASTSIAWLCVVMVVRGMGIGLAFMPAMTAAFAALERSELADATPQLNVFQRVGGAFGTAILAVVLQRALVGEHTASGAAAAYGIAFWASAALTVAAIVPCVILLRAERSARLARAGAALAEGDTAVEAAAA
jgi:EmrB/QacA subfamily drug resistance transporter